MRERERVPVTYLYCRQRAVVKSWERMVTWPLSGGRERRWPREWNREGFCSVQSNRTCQVSCAALYCTHGSPIQFSNLDTCNGQIRMKTYRFYTAGALALVPVFRARHFSFLLPLAVLHSSAHRVVERETTRKWCRPTSSLPRKYIKTIQYGLTEIRLTFFRLIISSSNHYLDEVEMGRGKKGPLAPQMYRADRRRVPLDLHRPFINIINR